MTRQERRLSVQTKSEFLPILVILLLLVDSLMIPIAIPYRLQTATNPENSAATSSLPWWNTNWHYRLIYNMTGSGNYSKSINFTSNLIALKLNGRTLDKDTITIVKSNNVKVQYHIYVGSSYNATHNAKLNVTWHVNEVSSYIIYFDVIENNYNRTTTPESTLNNITGTAYVVKGYPAEGWSFHFTNQLKPLYNEGTILALSIQPQALISNMTAQYIFNGNTTPLLMNFTGIQNIWKSENISLSRGLYHLSISARDQAGFFVNYSTVFLVAIVDYAINSTLPSYGYINNKMTITGIATTTNATVNVSCWLTISNTSATIKQQKNYTLKPMKNTVVSFDWTPKTKGDYHEVLSINCTEINDSNPNNDIVNGNFTVYGIPDVNITALTISTTALNVSETLTIHVKVNNTGDGPAFNYCLGLYLRQQDENTINYSSSPDYTSSAFSLLKNQYVTLNFTWKASYGDSYYDGIWHLGVKVIVNQSCPDSNSKNNNRTCSQTVSVNPTDSTKPDLYITNPGTIERYHSVKITCFADDDSGIQKVSIYIKRPIGTPLSGYMNKTTGQDYEYNIQNVSATGAYNVTIEATDNSYAHNKISKSFTFNVVADKTPPSMNFTDVSPSVQLAGEIVQISCQTWDFSGIKTVTLTITDPGSNKTSRTMIPGSNNFYYCNQTYSLLGKYTYTITSKDNYNLNKTSTLNSFWITNDLNDTDSDGMPDSWELQYGLNPKDPRDAALDADHDGTSNLDEYLAGTDPLHAPAEASAVNAIQDHLGYFIGSILLFLFILIVSVYLLRRKTP